MNFTLDTVLQTYMLNNSNDKLLWYILKVLFIKIKLGGDGIRQSIA